MQTILFVVFSFIYYWLLYYKLQRYAVNSDIYYKYVMYIKHIKYYNIRWYTNINNSINSCFLFTEI